jgi:hypothetical protein
MGAAERGLSTAAAVVLDFEGIGSLNQVGSYYDGVGGPDYGVVFGSSALGVVDRDAGGTASIANEPSPSTVLAFLDNANAYMTVSAGFTGLSFMYASDADADVTVYDGPGGTGNVLVTAAVPRTGICQFDFPDCGDPDGVFGKWLPLTVPPFSGVAKSVRFTGQVLLLLIDDVTIVPYQPTPPCTATTYWLWDPKTDAQLGELKNNTASCIAVPYNIEVRPCTSPATIPVIIKLTNAAEKTIKRQYELDAPYYLWGDITATGDVSRNTQPLPAGTYFLYTTIDGVLEKITFTQTC